LWLTMNSATVKRDLVGRLVRSSLVWAATIVILAAIFSRIPLRRVAAVLEGADPVPVLWAVVLSVFAHAVLAPAKYIQILKTLGCTLAFPEAAVLRMGTLPVKSVLPFKTGELSIIAYLRKVHGLPLSIGAASIVWGYILSAAVCVPVVLAGCYLYCPPAARGSMAASAIVLLAASAAYLWSRFKSSLPGILFFTAGFEGIKLLNTFLMFKALGVQITAGAFLIFAPLSLMIASIPVTVSGLGTREASVLFFFKGFAAPEALVGSSLLISLVNRVFPVLAGLLFLKPFLNRLSGSRPEKGGAL